MSVRTQSLDSLILDIHSAVLAPSNWDKVMLQIARLVGAEKATLFSLPSDHQYAWRCSMNMDPQTFVEYAAGHVENDVWLLKSMETSKNSTGSVNTGERLLERRRFLGTPFFNDYLKRYDIDRFMNVVMLGSPTINSPPGLMLSLFRGVGREEFGSGEISVLEQLAPHLSLAAQNCVAFSRLMGSKDALSVAVESLSVSIFTLDSDNKICGGNRAAYDLLAGGSIVHALDCRLCVGVSVRNPSIFKRILSQVGLGRTDCGLLEVGPNRLRHLIVAAPVTQSSDPSWQWENSARSVVWIANTASQKSVLDEFARLFLLSPAEQRLLENFQESEDLVSSAAVLRRSVHTVRAQMKSILRKTGCRAQGQLLALIARFSVVQLQAREISIGDTTKR